MISDWPSYWAGIATIPVLVGTLWLLLHMTIRALSKNHGSDGCIICDEGFKYKIGDHTRIGVWFRSRHHNWFIRNQKWHRDAWARSRWNPFRLPGLFDDGSSAAVRRKKPNILVRTWWVIFG